MGDQEPTPETGEAAPRMNPEIKAAWVAWLRDPQNVQGSGYLRRNDGTFCCLGGLCELAMKARVVNLQLGEPVRGVYVPTREITAEDYARSDYLATAVLSRPVWEWAGLTEADPRLTYNDRRVSLTVLNDVARLTFNQIADLIEEQL